MRKTELAIQAVWLLIWPFLPTLVGDKVIPIDEEKEKEEKKVEIEIEECDLEKKSLCKGSGGMQIGGGLDDDIMGDF